MTWIDFIIELIPVLFIPIAVILLAKAFSVTLKDLLSGLSWLLAGIRDWITRHVGHFFDKNNSELQRLSLSKRSKKFFYRYQNFINDILLDLKWKEKGLNVQTFTVANLIFSFVIALVIAIMFKNVISIVLFLPLVYVINVCVLFMISRDAHSYRVSLVRKAENTLCINMSLGVCKAVEVSINALPTDIRYVFDEFLYNINNTGMGVIPAIDKLNDSLGSDFDSFCKKAKTITLNSSMSPDIFLDNIKHNNAKDDEEHDVKKCYKELNFFFFIGMGAMLAFVGLMFIMVPSLRDFLHEFSGQMWVFALVLPIVIVFVGIQLQFSKKL